MFRRLYLEPRFTKSRQMKTFHKGYSNLKNKKIHLLTTLTYKGLILPGFKSVSTWKLTIDVRSLVGLRIKNSFSKLNSSYTMQPKLHMSILFDRRKSSASGAK